MNKYLHTVASVGYLFTLNYDAWNHELKIYIFVGRCCKNTNRKERMFMFVFCRNVFHLSFLHKFLRNNKAWTKHRNCL